MNEENIKLRKQAGGTKKEAGRFVAGYGPAGVWAENNNPVAIIDQFTVAHGSMQGITAIPIEEPTQFQTYVAIKNDKAPSLYAETFVSLLREEMNAVVSPRLRASAKVLEKITSG